MNIRTRIRTLEGDRGVGGRYPASLNELLDMARQVLEAEHEGRPIPEFRISEHWRSALEDARRAARTTNPMELPECGIWNALAEAHANCRGTLCQDPSRYAGVPMLGVDD